MNDNEIVSLGGSCEFYNKWDKVEGFMQLK